MAMYNKRLLEELLPKCELEIHESVGSTQEIANKCSWNPSNKPRVIIANKQNNGHGRYGRAFYSPANTGIYFSLILPPQTANPGLFTTGIAVSIFKSLSKFFPHKNFQFKWVNDIYLADKKIGGILVETVKDRLVCGVGLNISTEEFPSSLKQVAGSITQENSIMREYLLAAIINQIIQDIPNYNFGLHLFLYKEKSLILNHNIIVKINNESLEGVAIDITENGELVLQTSKQRHILNSGEITKIRRQKA